LYIEIPLVFIAIIGIFLKEMGSPVGVTIITASMLTLAFFYLLIGRISIGHQSKFDKIFWKIFYWVLAVCVVGILFTLTNWEGGKTMLTVGITGILLSLTYSIYAKFIKKTISDKLFLGILIRSVVALLTGSRLMFL